MRTTCKHSLQTIQFGSSLSLSEQPIEISTQLTYGIVAVTVIIALTLYSSKLIESIGKLIEKIQDN